MIKNTVLVFFVLLSTFTMSQNKPLKIGVAGLTHTHVHWILGRPERGDIEIVGIAEPNQALALRYVKQHHLDPALIYSSLDEMLKKTSPDAVTAFGTIFEHLEVVEKCAPKGIHVMVEKPLAVSMAHAIEMKKLADQYGISLLTNYETTWYATNHRAFEWIRGDSIGAIRKIVVHDGHPGPKEIGVNEEFLAWLTDPVQNGGGAITDFGCYGANLSTWLMGDEQPVSVTAVTQQIKPHIYPKVDDEATIIVTYPKAQTIIQASWNWPIHRKDMHVYGQKGYVFSENRHEMRYKFSEKQQEANVRLADRKDPYDDPFAYLAGVINGSVEMDHNALSSLENNMTVMQILDAAVQSAKTGKTIYLQPGAPR